MKYIVYMTVNLNNGKYYIGVHKTKNPKVFDLYLGCSIYINRPATIKHPKTTLQYAVKKYGFNSFKRLTLFIYDTEEEAYNMEALIVNEEFLSRPEVYNMIPGGRFNTNHANQYIPVYMYDLRGKFVREFETVTATNKFVDPKATSGGHLPRAIKQGHVHQGFQFSYTKVPCMKNYNKDYIKPENQGIKENKRIGRYDDEGQLLEEFENLGECVKAGYKNCKVVITGRRNYCKGFKFKYLD